MVAGDFIGRAKELEFLQDADRAPGSAFVPVYGRRRVGKCELIRHFMRNRPGIYLLGNQAGAEPQIREFLSSAAIALDEPLLDGYAASGWWDAFEAVLSRWQGPGKLIIALDEFQWLVTASRELTSVLQGLWDQQWSRDGKVFLILCGSYVGFMEREVLGRQSPLFGRRTGQIFLRPFGYLEAARFHPTYSLLDQVRTYFLCGGIPLYLKAFDPRRSFEQNAIAQILEEYGPLNREADFLLREELREVERYYGILLAVADGHVRNKDIAARTGLDSRNLSYYLKQLEELGYLSRRHPLTGSKPHFKQHRFELGDPLLRFWFRFVFPHTSYILQVGPERAWRERIKAQLDMHFGACFERLCREALPVLNAREGVAYTEVGEYWDASTQIDVVGLRDDGWTDLGECKWGRVPSAPGLVQELEAKVPKYPNSRNATIGRLLFTRRRPAHLPDAPAGTRWYCLEDLYAASRNA